MTKSFSRSQVKLIASTNAIFGADEACAMLRISRDAGTVKILSQIDRGGLGPALL